MAELGHVVLYVRDVERSATFYHEAVGLKLIGKPFHGRGALFTSGRTHHELMLIEMGDAPGPLVGKRLGLYHIGWKVGDSLDELRAVKARVEKAGYHINGVADHTVSKSLYLVDPDGNEIELYIDDPDINWQEDLSWIDDPVKPLEL